MRIARFWRIKQAESDPSKIIMYVTQIGSDSICYLDGRWSRMRAEARAAEVCLERGHRAFSIGEGRSFREALAAADVAKKVHIV
jgi:hypothetical protein